MEYGKEEIELIDNYAVFIEDDSETNFILANDVYNKLLEENNVYSVNLTEIIKSSDY